MATLYTMAMRILSELNRTDLSSQAEDVIRTAIKHYGNEPWGFNETSTATLVTSGATSIALPSDFISEVHVAIDQSGFRNRLAPISYQDWVDSYDDNYTGEPTRYAIFGDNLYFSPTVDSTYSYHLAYVFSLPELTSSASNTWITDCEELVRMRATADLLENYIRGPDAAQQAIVCRAREKEAYNAIRAKRTRALSTRIKRRGLL